MFPVGPSIAPLLFGG